MTKIRNIVLWLATAVIACTAVGSSAARKDEITLIMVPREDATVQLGMDVANKYPTLLVSYKLGANDTVSLHGWTGSQWVNVNMEDFLAGNFFRKGPDSALIVEKTGAEIPAILLPPPDWCANLAKITTTEMRPLLHLTGQYYDFSFNDWSWFAKRYNMNLDAINPEGLNVSWFHKRMEDHLRSSESLGASDLQFWISIRESVVSDPAAPAAVEAEETVPTMKDEPVGDPFTNTAPSAVIMGAAEAPAESAEETAPTAEVPTEEAAPENPEEME
jgi:hypothetical protein